MMTRKMVAGNWKMNGTLADLVEIDRIASALQDSESDVLICPPASLLHPMMAKIGPNPILMGGQDCHANVKGAHTGDISAEMLADCGASYVILGHSERRGDHCETNADIRAKIEAAHRANLTAILCVGETLEEREAGETLDVISAQLSETMPAGCTSDNLVVAYEPRWAIGTGLVPEDEQIAEVHAFIRKKLEETAENGAAVSILYGGSCKGSNAAQIFAIDHVNGALVGGASLKADDFLPIIEALNASN